MKTSVKIFTGQRQEGFTLIETVIAMVILSTALVLLANSWGGAFLRLRKTQTSFEVAAMLERKMNEIELEYRGKPLTEIPDEKSGDFGSDYPQYSWAIKSQKLEFPDISNSLTSGKDGADALTMSVVKQMTEFIGKSIKEVKLTVTYKKDKKPLEFSIVTYFIDYDQEASFGLPTGG